MKQFDAAIAAFEAGLAVDPTNDTLKDGLREATKAKTTSAAGKSSGGSSGRAGGAAGAGGFATNPFGPDMFARLAGNPRFVPYLEDPAFKAKLQALQVRV
jgi:hypothetical protein